jgi:hypothetical protein
MWYAHGGANVFIQDANNLIMRTEDLCTALRYLREKLPGIQRITSYGRSSTIARKSVEELKEIREAGLGRIHVGLESGSNDVLRFVKKGCTAQDHIDAGRKVVAAGISLSEYVMPGLGGKEWAEEHAVETAKVLNAIDPNFIRIRSTRVLPSFLLYDDLVAGRFSPLSDDDTVREIRRMVASIDGVHSTLTSDHIMNLLEEVEGAFPQDKPRMLAVMDRYLAMPPEERLLFRLGRRGGALRTLDDLNDPATRRRLQQAMQDLLAQTGGDLERLITELGNQYI